MNNAEYFAKMWEKAVNNSQNVKSLKLPSEK
jgi:hypothetical protein